MSPTGLLLAKHPEGSAWSDLTLLCQMANRHGLIAGATGTGKTVTLQSLAQGFSRMGVPVFTADVKGDLAGLSQPGDASNTRVASRLQQLGLGPVTYEACPVRFWDVFGEQGHPLRATVSEMGPLLLSRLLNLNEIQTGVLSVAFRVADDNGLLLLDLKDLRAIVQHVSDNAKTLRATYGNIAPASVGAIQRALLTIEEQGADQFFGEPALSLNDFMQVDAQGRGVINVLAADKLLQAPRVYASFLLWLMSELFEGLPEVGDREKPNIVFFFDEAHLLFDDAPKVLVDKIEQVIRLIRSKGVGIYFVTQNPTDVPDTVLGQLGNRVQHALRAFTPRDQKAVRAAAETFRQNPDFDVATAITELAVGEGLVSLLDDKGMPTVVQRALIVPPRSKIGPIEVSQRAALISASPFYRKYKETVDRESAYEVLSGRVAQVTQVEEAEKVDPAASREAERAKKAREKAVGGILTSFLKSAARSLGAALGSVLRRGILGGVSRSRRR